MARLGCHDCAGCSDCCRDMDQSITLDPYDIYLLTENLGCSFDDLINNGQIEFHIEEGLLLPNLKMVPKSIDLTRPPECYFLNSDGRCSIHSFRPGICRLFPLGRNYTDHRVSYFLLSNVCAVAHRDKVKISKWLGYAQIRDYENFLESWHTLRAQVRDLVNNAADEQYSASITTGFLKLFYQQQYSGDFFEEYKRRVAQL